MAWYRRRRVWVAVSGLALLLVVLGLSRFADVKVSAAWAGVAGAAVGGLIALAGTLFVERWRHERELVRWQREVRTQALLDIQEAISDMYDLYKKDWLATHTKLPSQRFAALSRGGFPVAQAVQRVNNLLHRIGDRELGERVELVRQAAGAAEDIRDFEASSRQMDHSYTVLVWCMNRVGELLVPLLGLDAPLNMAIPPEPQAAELQTSPTTTQPAHPANGKGLASDDSQPSQPVEPEDGESGA